MKKAKNKNNYDIVEQIHSIMEKKWDDAGNCDSFVGFFGLEAQGEKEGLNIANMGFRGCTHHATEMIGHLLNNDKFALSMIIHSMLVYANISDNPELTDALLDIINKEKVKAELAAE